MAPICKVGGLGDVVTALGRAVQEQGHFVEVILPRCAWQPPLCAPGTGVYLHIHPARGQAALHTINMRSAP